MNKAMWTSALGLALALVMSTPASTQVHQGQGLWQVTVSSIPVDLLTGPLKLTNDQKAKIRASQEKVVKATAEARKAQGASGKGGASVQAILDARKAADGEITAVLTGEQRSKVEGVVREFGSYQRLGIPLQIFGELKLTDGQKSKINLTAEDMQKKAQALRADGSSPDPKATQQMRQEYRGKVTAILTAEQNTAIEKWRKANRPPGADGNPAK